MFGIKKRRRQKLRAIPLPEDSVRWVEQNVPFVKSLSGEDRSRLDGLIQIFLDEKWFTGCGDLEITDEIRLTIAAQACVLLLRLDVEEVYPSLTTVVVYPHAYVANARRVVSGGIVIEGREVRLGESWDRGTLVLSWDDVKKGAADLHDGHNVVFHEFAHQLDQQAGGPHGTPELGGRSRYLAWGRVLGEEYQQLVDAVAHHRPTAIDAYGATNPAEFFAVVTESFFEKPIQLNRRHPELYDELRRFYRRDPAALQRQQPEALD